MRRRKSRSDIELATQKIQDLQNSPLAEIGMLLSNFLKEIREGSDDDSIIPAMDFVLKILDRLPQNFDTYFYFDAYIIRSIIGFWERGEILKCSKMILPASHNEWGYEGIRIPIQNLDPGPTIHLLYIPSNNGDGPLSLLDYPWMVHELGHYLISKHGRAWFDQFQAILMKDISYLQIRSVPDKGTAKIRAEKQIQEITEYWQPKQDQPSWPEEIAIDTISLWTCGPAYVNAYLYEHQEKDNPYIIDLTHPPVEIRTYALIHSAILLGWGSFIARLQEIQSRWKSNIPTSIYNQYMLLRREELISGSVASTIEYCEQMRIPRFDLPNLERIQRSLEQEETLEDGIDLIIGAWLVEQKGGESALGRWESRIREEFTHDITL